MQEKAILDVGVFPEDKANKNIATNHFLRQFKFDSKFYTGLGIEPMDKMKELYPDKRFVQYDGNIFPFKDKEFNWSHSNAVLEHVGNFDKKLLFIKEMVRVSENVYFTTPNKYFPVDSHTMVFFLHWNDMLFLKWRKKHNKWMPKDDLNLVSYAELKSLLNAAKIDNYRIIKNRVLGMIMTFTILIQSN